MTLYKNNFTSTLLSSRLITIGIIFMVLQSAFLRVWLKCLAFLISFAGLDKFTSMHYRKIKSASIKRKKKTLKIKVFVRSRYNWKH